MKTIQKKESNIESWFFCTELRYELIKQAISDDQEMTERCNREVGENKFRPNVNEVLDQRYDAKI